MSYFADLTPHTYTETNGASVLNVGWLDASHPFPQGETTPAFRESLRHLCERPILLHRGFHVCQFCPDDDRNVSPPVHPERRGNGQIWVQGADGVWYAAPAMVFHYVTEHRYLPPAAFIEAVFHPAAAEKMATLQRLHLEAVNCQREDFERFLKAVPMREPVETDRVPE